MNFSISVSSGSTRISEAAPFVIFEAFFGGCGVFAGSCLFLLVLGFVDCFGGPTSTGGALKGVGEGDLLEDIVLGRAVGGVVGLLLEDGVASFLSK